MYSLLSLKDGLKTNIIVEWKFQQLNIFSNISQKLIDEKWKKIKPLWRLKDWEKNKSEMLRCFLSVYILFAQHFSSCSSEILSRSIYSTLRSNYTWSRATVQFWVEYGKAGRGPKGNFFQKDLKQNLALTKVFVLLCILNSGYISFLETGTQIVSLSYMLRILLLICSFILLYANLKSDTFTFCSSPPTTSGKDHLHFIQYHLNFCKMWRCKLGQNYHRNDKRYLSVIHSVQWVRRRKRKTVSAHFLY